MKICESLRRRKVQMTMAKYLVPFEGRLLIEANSSQEAEIMALNWRQSLLRLKTESSVVKNIIKLTSHRDGVLVTSAPEVQGVDLALAAPPFVDVSKEIEAQQEEIIEADRKEWQQRGLPASDWTDEQIVLNALSHNLT